MTLPIDPHRRIAVIRRPARSAADGPDEVTGLRRVERVTGGSDEAPDASGLKLPVPVGKAVRQPPRPPSAEDSAMFNAQMMAQDGSGRGLRGGAHLLASAKATYNKTEWSGAKDRRRGKGRHTRTEA